MLSTEDILNNFRAEFARTQGSEMRADESDKLSYIERYRQRGIDDNIRPDWHRFNELWDQREESDDDMAELLAEVLGVAHDEALAWIEDY